MIGLIDRIHRSRGTAWRNSLRKGARQNNALKYILPIAGVAAGLVAPEILPGIFGADAAATGAVDVGALGADSLGAVAAPAAADAGALAGDAGLAATLNAAPDVAGGVTGVTEAAAPLASTAPALGADISGGLASSLSAAAPGADLASSLSGALPGATSAPFSTPLDLAGGGLGTTSAPGPSLLASTTSLPSATTPAAAGAGGALPGAGASAGAVAAPASVAAGDPLAGVADVAGGGPQDFSGGVASAAVPSSGTDTGFGSGLTSWLSQNKDWIGPAASVGGLGLSAIRDLQPLPGTNQIASAASSLAPLQAAETEGLTNAANTATGLASQGSALTTQGAQLAGYLQSGTLPPGIQQSIDDATKQAQASIKSMYDQRGQAGSSAEQEDLEGAQRSATAQGVAIAQQLLTTGTSEEATGTGEQQTALNTQLQTVTDALEGGVATSGLTADLYQMILSNTLSQSQQLGQAIGNFASSLVPRVQINAT